MSTIDDDRKALDQIMRDVDGWWPEAREVILFTFRRQVPITDSKRLDCGCEVHEEIHHELPDQPTEVIPLFYCPKHAPITNAQVAEAYRVLVGAERWDRLSAIRAALEAALEAS